MRFIKKYILPALVAIFFCSVAASCSQDEFELTPDNERALKLSAVVEGMITRSDDKAFWDNGDTIRVRIDSYPWVGEYTLNPDGTVQDAINALAWPYPDGFVSAWYPFLEEGDEVTITDQSEGYHKFDFLEAHTTRKMNYKEIVNLNFKHQMSKVRCEFIKGDGVTEEDLKTAKVSYYGFPTVVFSEQGISGKGSPTYITPTSDHSALIVPQDMSGQPFIKIDLTVTVNNVPIPKTLVYTPKAGVVNLEAGTFYTFNITVQKDRLEVQTISGAWTESLENTVPTSDKYHIFLTGDTGDLGDLEFSSNVTEKSADTRDGSVRCLEVLGNSFTISNKVTIDNCHLGLVFDDKETRNQVKRTFYEIPNASSVDGYYQFAYTIASPIGDPVYLEIGEHIEVGDILFQDGTWGGIPKKMYDGKKKPVGIVFKVGAGGASKNSLDVPANYGWNDSREIRGYAVALNDASGGRLKWGPLAKLDAVYDFTEENKSIIKYTGIIATKIAKSKGINNYPAFKAAIEYSTAAPEGSSGWYLPSYSQLNEVYKLSLHPQRRELLTDAGGSLFNPKYSYCTATERSASNIWLQSFNYASESDPNNGNAKAKSNTYLVRSVLTF